VGAYVLARCVAGATEGDGGAVSGIGRFAYLACFLVSGFLIFEILTVRAATP
jgi:hypothetical protein